MRPMKISSIRNVIVDIKVFLFKLRTVNSNAVIASVFGFERERLISDLCNSMVNSFEIDILPLHFGFFTRNREDLIENETAVMAKKTAQH